LLLCRPTDLSAYLLSFNGRLGRLVLDHELAARGLLSQAGADKAGVTSYPQVHVQSTSSMERGTPSEPTAAAAAAPSGPGGGEEIAASAKEVAEKAQQEGLDSAVPAATAAAAKGDIAGVAKAGADVIASAISGGSSSSISTTAEPLAPTTTPEPTDAASFKSQQQQQGLKRVLLGHSLGAVCAALEVIADPGKYSALVLVDPAIVSMGNGGSGAAALHLEEIHDDSSFTRSLASVEGGGVMSAAVDTAAERAMEGVGLGASSSSRSRSSSLDLEALAESTEMQRADSMFDGSSSSGRTSESGSSEVEEVAAAGEASRAAAAADADRSSSRSSSSGRQQQQQLLVAGEPVSYYATKGKVGRGAAAATAAEERSNLLFPLLERVQALLQAGFLMSLLMVISILRPVILVILRSAVRNRKFWKSGLQQAYYDKSKVDDEMVNAYRLPQLVKGWEDGMLQFLVARLGAGGPAASATDSAFGGLEDTRLAQRLAAVVNANNMPVLIVHGQGDKMVPVQNSFRLAKMMKRGRVAVLKRSGHCPQEELPEAFSEVVGKFLSHVLKK
jgi:pimeloyl-ACP methyl ester carboxylesterase